jgi:histidyl-tRNA synthetase
MIDTLVGFLRDIGVRDVEVLVNSLGGPDTRVRYREALRAALEPKKAELSPDSQRRLSTNPLRILDSKDPRDAEAVVGCPPLSQFLSEEDRAHFAGLERCLKALGTPYRVDPKLVRGLDYYTRTLFEIKGAKDKLGAGDTLVGGGRYDGMIAELGGPAVPAIGFAAGIERLLIASDIASEGAVVDAYVAPIGEKALAEGLVLARDLRAAGVRTEVDGRGGSLKSQLRRANALGAKAALILGDREIADGVVELKDLGGHAQQKVARADVVARATALVSQSRDPSCAPAADAEKRT